MPALPVGAVRAEVGLALFREGLVRTAVHWLVCACLEEHLGLAPVGHGCGFWFDVVECFRGEGGGVGGQGLAAGRQAAQKGKGGLVGGWWWSVWLGGGVSGV